MTKRWKGQEETAKTLDKESYWKRTKGKVDVVMKRKQKRKKRGGNYSYAANNRSEHKKKNEQIK